MPTVQYRQYLGSLLDKSKEKTPKQFRIGDTYFTSLAMIGGNLFTRHLNNLNHVHKDSNNLLSVIIIWVTNIHGGKTVFNDGVDMNDIGKISHVLNHLNGRCVVGAFDKIFNEGYIWTVHRAILYFILHKSIFIQFVHYRTKFYDRYITSDDGNKYMDDYGSGISPKQKFRKLYNAKYQNTYSNRYYVLKKDYIKYTRVRQTYTIRKLRATCFVYLKGSPYLDA